MIDRVLDLANWPVYYAETQEDIGDCLGDNMFVIKIEDLVEYQGYILQIGDLHLYGDSGYVGAFISCLANEGVKVGIAVG